MVPLGRSEEQMPPAHSELRLRIFSAIVLIALALATLLIGGWLFDLVWTLLAIAVFREWIVVARASMLRERQAVTVIALGLLGLALWFEHGWLAAFAVIAGAAVQMLLGTGRIERLWSVAGFFYSSALACGVILVRHDPAFGLAGIAWMFAVVWTTDIAAFFTGRALGGPKLAPSISPKKTWSGFLGGLIAGTVAGWLVFAIAYELGTDLPFGTTGAFVVSAIASVLGQTGDLAESAFKRHFGVKDSGSLIPGHGGFLDRLDAFWAVSVFALVLLAARAVHA